MTTARALMMRNLRVFFRDPASVFFSLMAALIQLGIYVLFLNPMQVNGLRSVFPDAATIDLEGFMNSWVFAGTVTIAAATTGIGALAGFVDDGASGRFQDFLVSPVRRWQLVLGYLTASFIVALVMSFVILVASQLYLLIQGQPVMSASNFASCLGAVTLWAAAFCAFSSLMVTFLHSNGAFGAFNSTFGVLVGFLAGAYLPPGVVPARFANVLNALPFAQAAMLVRVPFTEKALTGLTAGNPAARTELENVFGMRLAIGDYTVSTGLAVGSLAAVTVVFFVLGVLRIRQQIR